MRDHRTDRATRDLPAGYQFGDARWRRPSENAAEQLCRRAPRCGYCRNQLLDQIYVLVAGEPFCSYDHWRMDLLERMHRFLS